MFEAIIKAKTASQLRALRKFGIGIKDHSAFQDKNDYLYRVDAIVSDEDINRLESEGYIVEKVSNLTDIAKSRLKEVSRTNRFREANTMADLGTFAVAGGYKTVEEIDEAIIQFNKINPNLVELIELPNKTWEKRTSTAIRIHTNTRTDKPAVMFIGGVHAREWGTSDICIHFISKLIESYTSNTQLKYGNKTFTANQIKTILENIDIIVFPLVNPDGRAYSQKADNPDDPNTNEIESVWWRKNRNPNRVPNPQLLDPERHKSAGVDLNRNYGFLWETGIGTEEDGKSISEVYKGPQPFSEPESKNVKYLIDKYKNIKCFVDIHCHVGSLLMSWGHDDLQCFYPEQNYRNPEFDGERGTVCGDLKPDIYKEYMHPDDVQKLAKYAKSMSDALYAVRERRYIEEPAVGLYPTSGSSQDYAFSQRDPNDENKTRIFAYTIEFGASARHRQHRDEDTFIPEYNVMKNIMNDIGSALTGLCFALANENIILISSNTNSTDEALTLAVQNDKIYRCLCGRVDFLTEKELDTHIIQMIDVNDFKRHGRG
jgi:murein tripeptide amidase MpaA